MKHIQVVAYCDGAIHVEERVRSTIERQVSVDGAKPVLLDLCEPCDKPFQDLLALMERGSVVETKQAPPKRGPGRPRGSASPRGLAKTPGGMPSTCPECGHHSITRSGLGQHMSQKHHKGLKDFTDEQFTEAESRWQSQQDATPAPV